jgi:tetratricopeptide (TPR) repeat protein
VQQQLSDVLDETGDKKGARTQLEASVATWRRAIKANQINYKFEIKLAEALISLADLSGEDDATISSELYTQAANLMGMLLSRVPQQGRSLVLEPQSRALYRAGDVALGLKRTDESVARHQQALKAAVELASLKTGNTETQIDLGRQHGRLARALEAAKRYAQAHEHAGEARRLFVEHRGASRDHAAVDRLITWTDKLVEEIEKGETERGNQPQPN